MYCKKCGALLPDDAAFCGKCGAATAPVAEEPAVADVSAAAEPAGAAAPAGAEAPPAAEQPAPAAPPVLADQMPPAASVNSAPPAGKTKGIVIAAVVVALAVICIAALALLGGGAKAEPVIGHWEMYAVYDSDTESTQIAPRNAGYFVEFRKDGSATLQIGDDLAYECRWSFNQSKSDGDCDPRPAVRHGISADIKDCFRPPRSMRRSKTAQCSGRFCVSERCAVLASGIRAKKMKKGVDIFPDKAII